MFFKVRVLWVSNNGNVGLFEYSRCVGRAVCSPCFVFGIVAIVFILAIVVIVTIGEDRI